MQGEVRAGRRERTWNMYCMLVTLDVSKLSGWLNAYACCRVERRAYDAGRGVGQEAGGRVGRRRRKRHAREGPTQGCGPGHARSARGTSAPWS